MHTSKADGVYIEIKSQFIFFIIKVFSKLPKWFEEKHKKSYKNASSGRISNPLSIPPTTYARAILDEKVKKNFCDEKINALYINA